MCQTWDSSIFHNLFDGGFHGYIMNILCTWYIIWTEIPYLMIKSLIYTGFYSFLYQNFCNLMSAYMFTCTFHITHFIQCNINLSLFKIFQNCFHIIQFSIFNSSKYIRKIFWINTIRKYSYYMNFRCILPCRYIIFRRQLYSRNNHHLPRHFTFCKCKTIMICNCNQRKASCLCFSNYLIWRFHSV